MIREAQREEGKELFGEQIALRQIQPKGKDFGVLAQYLDKRIHIRFRYKGKLYIAHVRKDGWITFAAESAEAKRLQGKEFKSPSSAASAITGRARNGWKCWKYERSPGEWVLLEELRKR
jgi:hypothetical protein